MDDAWTPVLRNLAASYQTRLTLDLLGGPARRPGLFAALFNSVKAGSFDITYEPDSAEQIMAGQIVNRDNRLYFDTWTNFPARPSRKNPEPAKIDLTMKDYRIDATVSPDLSMSAVTRVKVQTPVDGMVAAKFEIAQEMAVTEVKVNGVAAEVLQQDSLRSNLTRGGNSLFLVVPAEPLRAGREYEFEIHHSGRVILDAGDRVFYVTARGNWYPLHGFQFANYDLLFRYPRDLDLVAPGDVTEDRTEGEWHITRRRTSTAIRDAGFNLGSYAHVHLEHGGYTVDVCANRALERSLQSRAPETPPVQVTPRGRPIILPAPNTEPPPNPLEGLQALASEVASALEYMVSKFGPPALPHLTVTPIPGTFGQGFPGLIYLSTLSYLKTLPRFQTLASESQQLFFQDVLQAHETAHQWWGNRVTAATYRDNWLMEALANYSALLYLEKRRGARAAEVMLDQYRTELLNKNESGQSVDSTGPIVLGSRLGSSRQPAAWRVITYGKGTWIMQMLRRRLGDERFLAMLAETIKRYDHSEISTDQFRQSPPSSCRRNRMTRSWKHFLSNGCTARASRI